VLAVAPWNFLDNDCLAVAAIDTPHGIKQKDQKTPEGNELETALGELIVSRSGLMAAGTNRPRALAGTHSNLDAPVVRSEAGLAVNKAGKTVATI
jgi:hypothetical protein